VSSVREQIVDNLEFSLRQMREGAGYYFDWSRFYRWRVVGQPDESPAVRILDTSETVEDLANGLVDRFLSVELLASHQASEWVQPDESEDGAGPGTLGSWLIEDLERAVMADRRRGGLAVDTTIVSTDKTVEQSAAPMVWASVVLEIRYRTPYDDPATAR
jgi:hypothetical protein